MSHCCNLPNPGTRLVDPETGQIDQNWYRLFLSYFQRVGSSDGTKATLGFLGEVRLFAGPTARIPLGWLTCGGASLLRADYPGLFTIIGTTFGAVDGTHFTLPTIGAVVANVIYIIKAAPAAIDDA